MQPETVPSSSPTSPRAQRGRHRRATRRRTAGLLTLAVGMLTGSVVALGAAGPAAASDSDTVTVVGAGFGHGVGMSQYGALGQAKAGATAAQILTHYYSGTTVGPVTDNVDLHVNVAHGAASVTLRSIALATGGGAVQLALGSIVVQGTAADSFTVKIVNGAAVLTRTSATGVVTSYSPTTAMAITWSGTRAVPGAATALSVNGRLYAHGQAAVNVVNGALEVNVIVRLHDEYLYGLAEMPSSWPLQALRSQIIASRSYALVSYGGGSLRASCACHVFNGTSDQVYVGWSKESEPGGWGAAWKSAVDSTAASPTTGLAVLYSGRPVKAYFFSSSGGHTRSSQDVWGGILPWAVSVDDRWSLDPTLNPNARWTKTVTVATLRSSVFPSLPDLARLQLTTFNADGTPAVITAWSAGGVTATTTGDRLRSALGLKSAWVTSFMTTLPTTVATPGAFTSLAPSRVLDTRIGNGAPAAPVASGATLRLQVTGRGGVPATGVSAVVLNVTVTRPTATGYVTVFPDGTAQPNASNLNFVPGQTVPNLVVVKVGTGGMVDLTNMSPGSTHLVADVAGYYG